MNYQVGQVIYLLNEKSLKVIPCLVTEELIKSSLEGKEVSYTIRLPGLKQKELALSETGMKTFSNLVDAQSFMIDNAKLAIEALVETARRFEEEFFSDTDDENLLLDEQEASSDAIEAEITKMQKNEKDDKIKVDIGNGVMANISVDNLEKLVER